MRIVLNDGWKLSGYDLNSSKTVAAQPGMMTDDWMEAAVPGDVHSTLLHYGKIADPFYSTNVEKCRWVEEKIWWYRKEFCLEKPLAEGEVAQLQFDGLDTFATVFLNGELLGTHANMFTPAVFDVTRKLIPGINLIAVRFDSTIAETSQKEYGGMWYSYSPNRVWARKAQMNFRWDWGPRLITVGIWKDVSINIFHQAKLDQVFVSTKSVDNNEVELEFEITAELFEKKDGIKAEVELTGNGMLFSKTVSLDKGVAKFSLMVNQPKLWWTHDLGEPYLYNCLVNLVNGSEVLDSYHTKVGIRRLEVVREAENGAKRFTFVLNGVPLFAKGANWVPAHSLVGTIKDATYARWIAMAKECHMNMLRVWGGGIYEKAAFYEECDRQGILVWQDFMFTCSSYPDFDAEFMENVRQEITYVVKSLRNYASLALWCGNNEIQWLHGQKLPDLKDLRLYGEKIFRDLMPELLAELDPTRLYWPSSPFGGNDPNSHEEGDTHNWQVWAGTVYPHLYGERVITDNTPEGISFKKYAEDTGKFISEFGMHASPVLETLQSCIPPKQLYLNSFEMRYRNKDKRPTRGKLLMESYTGLPATLEQYIDYSMLAQGEGLKYGIEHFRRRKPECSGTLIWQLNDCWPALSWSIVDFYFRPKAGYYYTKRVYQPILLSWKAEGPDRVSLWVTNDTLSDYRDSLEVELQDFFGNREYYEEFQVTIPANQSRKVKEFSRNRMNVTYTNFEFLAVRPHCKNVGSNIFFFEDYKDLNLPPCQLAVTTLNRSVRQMEVKIKTDFFAKFVKVIIPEDEVKLSDNYFDLMPGETKTVTVSALRESLPAGLKINVTALNQDI